MATDLSTELSQKTSFLGLKVWEIIGIVVGLFIIIILCVLSFCITSRKKSRRATDKLPLIQIPAVSKEITEVKVDGLTTNNARDKLFSTTRDKSSDRESDKASIHLGMSKTKTGDSRSHSGSSHYVDKDDRSVSGEECSSGMATMYKASSYPITAPSPLAGLPEYSELGWGHWFTLRDLEIATNRFSKENIIGEGGYGIVYRGQLINGTPVAVKRILNNL